MKTPEQVAEEVIFPRPMGWSILIRLGKRGPVSLGDIDENWSRAERLREFRAALAAILRAYHEAAVAEGMGEPPVTAERLAEVRREAAAAETIRRNERTHDLDMVRVREREDLLALVDFYRDAAAWHARESGHLEEYRRGYAAGIAEGKRRCVEAASHAPAGTSPVLDMLGAIDDVGVEP